MIDRKSLFAAILAVAAGFGASPAQAVTPNPILYLTSTEFYTANGQNFIRYRYDVLNKAEYPAAFFTAAPALPPCGNNHNASRAWVDFFDQLGHRIYGFCTLGSSTDLGQIWFSVPEGQVPPSYVHIEITDRQTGTKYVSNPADTVM